MDILAVIDIQTTLKLNAAAIALKLAAVLNNSSSHGFSANLWRNSKYQSLPLRGATMSPQDYPDSATSQAFFKALVGEDHLGFVIRAHIHIEHALRRLIEIAIPHPENLDIDQLSYSMAVRLTTSLGLNPRFRGPLQALGKLRNKFAHQLDAQITDDDAVKFYNSFSTVDKQVIQQQYSAMRAEKLIGSETWEERDAKDKITFCVAVLRAALLAAQDAYLEGPPEMKASLAQLAGKSHE